jgi:hypothetical protein
MLARPAAVSQASSDERNGFGIEEREMTAGCSRRPTVASARTRGPRDDADLSDDD